LFIVNPFSIDVNLGLEEEDKLVPPPFKDHLEDESDQGSLWEEFVLLKQSEEEEEEVSNLSKDRISSFETFLQIFDPALNELIR